jgi:long-chain fatty acid transport protein
MRKNVKPALAALTMLVGAGEASAAGFSLSEQNASGLGNAYAGAAAVAEDASTIFFNPAGLSFLGGAQVVLGADYIKPSIKFSNDGNSAPPLTIGTLGTNGGNAGKDVVVPDLYLSIPIGSITLGIGANAPFGLKDEYDSDFMGRFQGIKSEVTTYNINPTIAWKVNNRFSVGAGVSYQYVDVELTNKVNAVGINPIFAGQEFNSSLKGNDYAYGWNVGGMFQASEDMRIGASYRSKLKYTIDGNATITTPTGATILNTPAHADLTLPDMASLSVFQRFNDQWDFMGDITWTHWSEIDTLKVIQNSTGAQLESIKLGFDDTWRISFGLNYHLSNAWTLKGGFAWDQTPVKDENRQVRLPDNDRYWLSIGAKWRPTNSFWIDAGYAHLFVKSASINQNQGNQQAFGLVSGSYDNSVDILGVQLTYQF